MRKNKNIALFFFLLAFCLSAEAQVYTPELDSAYKLLSKKKTKEAVVLFESHIKQHPEDTRIYLQLAYIYDSQGNYTKSLRYFEYVKRNSTKKEEVETASASIIVMREKIISYSKNTFELGTTSFYDSYQDNYITGLTAYYRYLVSKEFFMGFYLDLYTDSKTTKELVYNDRYVEAGGYLRFYFFPVLYFETRIGVVQEIDFEKTTLNISPRLLFGTRVGNPAFFIGRNPKSRSAVYMDIFSMISYDYKFKNAFFQLSLEEALRLNITGFSYIEPYSMQYLIFDNRRLDYNNYVEFGLGLRYKPDLSYFPLLFVIPTYKTYFFGSRENTFQIKAGFNFFFRIKL